MGSQLCGIADLRDPNTHRGVAHSSATDGGDCQHTTPTPRTVSTPQTVHLYETSTVSPWPFARIALSSFTTSPSGMSTSTLPEPRGRLVTLSHRHSGRGHVIVVTKLPLCHGSTVHANSRFNKQRRTKFPHHDSTTASTYEEATRRLRRRGALLGHVAHQTAEKSIRILLCAHLPI